VWSVGNIFRHGDPATATMLNDGEINPNCYDTIRYDTIE